MNLFNKKYKNYNFFIGLIKFFIGDNEFQKNI